MRDFDRKVHALASLSKFCMTLPLIIRALGNKDQVFKGIQIYQG